VNVLRTLLTTIGRHIPSRTYFGVNGPYLTKYTLFHGGKAGWKLYLNHILRSDEDPDPHDHPWAWMVAWVLVGGYVEHRKPDYTTPWTSRTRYPGLPYVMTRTTRHRVELRAGTSWSLFLCGPSLKGWGFWTPTGFVDYATYLHNKGLKIYKEPP
jgi:hypothetical protein